MTELSPEPLANTSPSELREIDRTQSVWPLNVFVQNPDDTSQHFKVESREQVYMTSFPNTTDETEWSWPRRVLTQEKVDISQTFALISADAEARKSPAGLKLMPVTDPVCPFNVRSY